MRSQRQQDDKQSEQGFDCIFLICFHGLEHRQFANNGNYSRQLAGGAPQLQS